MTWTCKHDVSYGSCVECQSDKKPNITCPECGRELSAQENGLVMFHSAPGMRDTCPAGGKAVARCDEPHTRYETTCGRPKGHDGRHAYIIGGEVRERAPAVEPEPNTACRKCGAKVVIGRTGRWVPLPASRAIAEHYECPVVEPVPTSVGNAASDPHLASYCTNPDCVKIVNHDGDCVVEPCEGCPDPELPCKGCPAVEPEQTLKGPQPNPRYATGGPEYVAWCEGHEAGWSDAQQGKTTNLVTDYGRGYEDGQDAERARIERIIENHRDSYFGDSPGVYDALLRDIRKGL